MNRPVEISSFLIKFRTRLYVVLSNTQIIELCYYKRLGVLEVLRHKYCTHLTIFYIDIYIYIYL